MKKLALLFILLPFLLAAAPTRQAQMDDMRKRIEQMEEQMGALQEEVAVLQREFAAVRQVIRLSPTGVQIRSEHGLQIQSLGTLDLKGKVIRFNGGDRPAAAVGSKISAPPLTGSGVIVEGSPTILLK